MPSVKVGAPQATARISIYIERISVYAHPLFFLKGSDCVCTDNRGRKRRHCVAVISLGIIVS